MSTEPSRFIHDDCLDTAGVGNSGIGRTQLCRREEDSACWAPKEQPSFVLKLRAI